MLARALLRAVELALEGTPQDIVHEGALSRAAHPGHAGEEPEWDLGGDALEVILTGTDDAKPLVLRVNAAARRDETDFAREIASGE